MNAPAKPPADEWLTVAELSELTRISSATLYHLVRIRQLPGARHVGRRIVVHLPTFTQTGDRDGDR